MLFKLLLCLVGSCLALDDSEPKFDLFVFAQVWPTTSCIEWKERRKEDTCALPASKTLFTVHGVWPSKWGEMNPLNCPGPEFDPHKLDPILDELNNHWTNVHANSDTYSFWKHEWDKHGRCASVLPQMADERKYFEQGILLNEKYPVYQYLAKGGVTPSDGTPYSFTQIFDAVKEGLGGKHPAIQCEFDKERHRKTLSQISICLNNSTLEVIDCDRAYGGLDQQCGKKGEKDIYYPDANMFNQSTYWMASIFGLLMLIILVLATLKIVTRVHDRLYTRDMYERL